jgi:TPR repeat protein
MKKYYTMAIGKGNSRAMYDLGVYYERVEKDYDLMKKYFMMAIRKGNSYTMYRLGYYYQFVEKNYNLMKKYFMMAIDKGSGDAMYNLGEYYENVEKNYDLMKKYYIMAIKKGNSHAMRNMNNYNATIFNNFINNINDINNYQKTITYHTEKTCLICKEINQKYLIDTGCKNIKNDNLDHYYCSECMKKWYKTNDFKCLICNTKLVIENFVLNIFEILD